MSQARRPSGCGTRWKNLNRWGRRLTEGQADPEAGRVSAKGGRISAKGARQGAEVRRQGAENGNQGAKDGREPTKQVGSEGRKAEAQSVICGRQADQRRGRPSQGVGKRAWVGDQSRASRRCAKIRTQASRLGSRVANSLGDQRGVPLAPDPKRSLVAAWQYEADWRTMQSLGDRIGCGTRGGDEDIGARGSLGWPYHLDAEMLAADRTLHPHQ